MVLPLVGFAGLAALFELTDLDLLISDLFYDFPAARWPYGRSWWANEMIHVGGRWLVGLVGFSGLVVFLLSWRVRRLRAWRRPAVYCFLTIGLATGSVLQIQLRSARHCPRAIDRYGGSAPHLGLFEAPPTGIEPGRCFPAKHAAAGFSLFCLYFACLDRRRRWSRWGLVVSLVLGSVYTFGQLVRGAHFVSHCLWSAAICWGFALGLYTLLLYEPRRQTAQPP